MLETIIIFIVENVVFFVGTFIVLTIYFVVGAVVGVRENYREIKKLEKRVKKLEQQKGR